MGQFSNILQRYQRKQSNPSICYTRKSYKNIIMKAFNLCVTVLAIANVNGALRPLDSFDDTASDRIAHSAKLSNSELKAWGTHRWNEASDHLIRDHNTHSQNEADSLSDASIEPLWHYCGSGNELLLKDLVGCLPTIIGWGSKDASEAYRNYIMIILDDTWNLIDEDENGSLNFEEFKSLISAFATIDAEIIFDNFNADENHLLNLAETTNWMNTMYDIWAHEGLKLTDEQEAYIKAAYLSTQNGEKDNQMVTADIAKVVVQLWAMWLN